MQHDIEEHSDDNESGYINQRIGLKKLKTDKFEEMLKKYNKVPLTAAEREAHGGYKYPDYTKKRNFIIQDDMTYIRQWKIKC